MLRLPVDRLAFPTGFNGIKLNIPYFRMVCKWQIFGRVDR
jgi:hypothetical protein